tara:strand:+ start:776 stop:1273 length:498 start_codon:yes stop_codon:yes gene_type:complete
MWTVIKYKKNNLPFLAQNLREKFGDIFTFYNPKIKYEKISKSKRFIKEKYILGNYIFCYSKNFIDLSFVNSIKNLKGLDYFLNGYKDNQKNIENFISNCKNYEISDQVISPKFFLQLDLNSSKFLNGLFANKIFKILEKRKNKILVSLDGLKAEINTEKNLYFSF